MVPKDDGNLHFIVQGQVAEGNWQHSPGTFTYQTLAVSTSGEYCSCNDRGAKSLNG